jgi:2-oxoglutarate dehydrogenase dihydrolipoamide succinyltransferase (E2 component)
MRVEVVMPKMGESLQEGTIINWMKQVGDSIERDEMILEISTDKVDTEVPSPNSGVLAEILVQVDETVDVGTPIAIIETDVSGSDASAEVSAPVPAVETAPTPAVETISEPTPVAEVPAPPTPPAPPAPASGGDTIDLVMPKMGESLQEGTIVSWLKQVGDTIERDEMILEISTDKVDTEVPSPVAGTLVEILAQEEETVDVGAVIAKISTGSGVAVSAPTPPPTPVAETQPAQTSKPAMPAVAQSAPAPSVTGTTYDIPKSSNGKFFSPLVRAIAKDNKVSLEELVAINGSGVDGRVNKKDILDYISGRGSAPVVQSSPTPAQVVQAPTPVASTPAVAQSAPSPAKPVAQVIPASTSDHEVIPMDRMRKLIAAHMTMSKQTSAHVTSVAEVDVTNLVRARARNKDAFLAREGTKLTYTSFFTKAVVEGVRAFPGINVSVDGTNMILHKRTNLGFAAALPDGNLIVPVIKNAGDLTIAGLQRSVNDLATRARTKKLVPDDIQGGTITLTNVGTFGTLFGSPIINQPQTCIIGVGAIKKRPMVMTVDGQDTIAIRSMMYMSITYDHRIIDGMLAGQALAHMVKTLESMNDASIEF